MQPFKCDHNKTGAASHSRKPWEKVQYLIEYTPQCACRTTGGLSAQGGGSE
jgi:hypothetical protein